MAEAIGMVATRMGAVAPAGLVVIGLAGCSIPLSGSTTAGAPQPSEAAVAACNARADEVFLRQNRDAIYKADRYSSSIRDSPLTAGGLPQTSAGLSDQYARNQGVRTCLNGVGTPIRSQPADTAAP